MQPAPILDLYRHGPVQVFLDTATGAVLGVVDLATGEAAERIYRPAYIAQAKTQARAHWQSRADH